MASTLDITVSSSQILASQIYLKSINSRYIRGPLILPGVTNCFAVFIKFQAFVVTKLHPIPCQDPVQYQNSFKQQKVLIKLIICRFSGHFMKAYPFFSGIWSSINPAACLLTLPAVIQLANRNAGSIVRAL